MALTQKVLTAFDSINNNVADPEGEHLIKEILAECRTLEQIKQVEESKYRELSQTIRELRTLTHALIQEVELWRSSLATMHNTDMFDRLNRVRIMFIRDGTNILVSMLYDTGFLANSFLGRWMNFVEKNDPFFIEILKEMPENRVQTLVLDGLRDIEDSEAVLKMVYKLTQELNHTKNVLLPQTKSNKSSRRPSKESVKTPREEGAPSPKQKKPEAKSEAKSELNILSSQNRIEIIYKPGKKAPKGAGRPESELERAPSAPKMSVSEARPSVDESASVAAAHDLQELKRLSIERDKLEKQLEKERKLKQREADEYNRKLEKLDSELGKYREEATKQKVSQREMDRAKEDLLRAKEHELRELRNELRKRDDNDGLPRKHERAPSATERRVDDSSSATKIYKASSKGFSSIKNKQESEKVAILSEKEKLEKMLLLERKRQSKEVSDYTRKLEEYDNELNKMREERNAQKMKLREIEKEKQERIREKEAELLAIKKYMNDELKKKAANEPGPRSVLTYKEYREHNPSPNPDNEHELERQQARRRIEEIYSSRKSSNSLSKYESAQSGSSVASGRVKSIEIVYDKRSNELKTLARQIKRTDRELGRLRGLDELDEGAELPDRQSAEDLMQRKSRVVSDIYGSQTKEAEAKLKASRLLERNRQLEQQRNQLRIDREEREHELLLQKQNLMKEYDEKMEAERSKYKREMESLADTLKNRELQLLNEVRVELQEQKALREEKERELQDELRERQALEKEKAALEAERERLALEVEMKRLKEDLERQIRDELIQIHDIKKDEEDADTLRRLKEQEIQNEILELERRQNDELARLDEENDELRKHLLSRKKKLINQKTQDNSLLGVDELGRPDYLRPQKTEPVEANSISEEIKRRTASKNLSELIRPSYEGLQKPARDAREYTVTSSSKTQNLESLLAELRDKADMQRHTTGEVFKKFKKAEKEPDVSQADDVEGLVRMYQLQKERDQVRTAQAQSILKEKKKSDQFLAAAITQQSKQQIIESLMQTRKKREGFEKELAEQGAKLRNNYGEGSNEVYYRNFMDLRVESELNAVAEFQERHRHALKTNESYNSRELETEERPLPPPRTIREHIIVHQKVLEDKSKQHQKKNFFKINRDNLKPKSLREEESKSLPKPARLTEEVLRRQEEAVKKYMDRAKAKDKDK